MFFWERRGINIGSLKEYDIDIQEKYEHDINQVAWKIQTMKYLIQFFYTVQIDGRFST